jgi:hypothetical protein
MIRPTSHLQLKLMLAAALAVLLLGGCGVPSTPIQSAGGELRIQAIEKAQRFPPNCQDRAAGCSIAEPGYSILIVGFRFADGRSPLDAGTNTPNLNDGIQLAAADQTFSAFASQFDSRDMRLAFAVPEGTSGFTLVWPGNPPIELGQ